MTTDAMQPDQPTTIEFDTDRDVDKTYSTRAFVAKLRRLADALEQGRPFTIQVAGERFTVPPEARISVEHERSGADEEVEFQLTWRRS